MSSLLKPHIPPEDDPLPRKRRSVWRQRLVDAERGLTAGVRGDSTFFVHFFIGSVVVVTGMVLGLGILQWGLLILALTVVLSAEMFHQVLKAMVKNFVHHFSDDVNRAMGIASAAVFVTILGAVLAVGLIFGERISHLLAG